MYSLLSCSSCIMQMGLSLADASAVRARLEIIATRLDVVIGEDRDAIVAGRAARRRLGPLVVDRARISVDLHTR